MSVHLAARKGDVSGLTQELDAGAFVDARDEQGRTPLMLAVTSDQASLDTVHFLLERGADVNAVGGDYPQTVLSQAIGAGDPLRAELLIEAGADCTSTDENGYDALIHAMHGRDIARDDRLLSLVELLVQRGAPLRGESDFGESALSVSSHQGRFDVVARLLEAGADESVLEWTPLARAVVLGGLDEVAELLFQGANLNARDRWERTPWLLAVCTGDTERAQLLLDADSNRNDAGRGGKTALMYAAQYGHLAMLAWLLQQGFDSNGRDKFGDTALLEAAECNDFECVRLLLETGADANLKNQADGKPISKTSSPEIIRLLVDAGQELGEVEEEVRAALLGLDWEEELMCSRQEYEDGKRRRFGEGNPQRMDVPFWQAMVWCGWSAASARMLFDGAQGEREERDPVWCYRRFGKSITQLPDGRFLEIGGEHEDFYDPDFCIYNDVFVHDGQGGFEIFSYPKEVFPPTDFHSATLVGSWIYIIGCMGYDAQQVFGHTPVYRIHIDTLAIERIETMGDNPGWICRHRAVLVGEEIHVSGGQTWSGFQDNDERGDAENEDFEEEAADEIFDEDEDVETEESEEEERAPSR